MKKFLAILLLSLVTLSLSARTYYFRVSCGVVKLSTNATYSDAALDKHAKRLESKYCGK